MLALERSQELKTVQTGHRRQIAEGHVSRAVLEDEIPHPTNRHLSG